MTNAFGAESTTDEVLEGVDLKGKRIFVTGVSAGLGIETARVLAAHGADIVGEIGSRYCEDCHVAEIWERDGIRGGVRPYALDPERAKASWEKSEEMIGERF